MFIYSGLNASNIPESIILNNQDSLNFSIQNTVLPGLANGKINLMDVTGDSLPDLLMHGLDTSDQPFTDIFYNTLTGFTPANLGLTGITAGKQMLADLNADGFPDIVLNGTDGNQNIVSQLYENDGNNNYVLNDSIFTPTNQPNHTFGIIDCDGNLDLAQWSEDNGNSNIQFFTNGSAPNDGPSPPSEHYVFNTNQNVILYWNNMNDDNHSSAGITSDLFIGDSEIDPTNLAPNFDLFLLNRLLVSHGNQGYNRNVTIEELDPKIYHYGIQSIDNSFFANSTGCSGNGSGSGPDIARGKFIVCNSLTIDTLTACIGSSISLPGGAQTVYYSEQNGFLGNAETLQYPVSTEPDTLYFTTIGSIKL